MCSVDCLWGVGPAKTELNWQSPQELGRECTRCCEELLQSRHGEVSCHSETERPGLSRYCASSRDTRFIPRCAHPAIQFPLLCVSCTHSHYFIPVTTWSLFYYRANTRYSIFSFINSLILALAHSIPVFISPFSHSLFSFQVLTWSNQLHSAPLTPITGGQTFSSDLSPCEHTRLPLFTVRRRQSSFAPLCPPSMRKMKS